MSWVFNPFTGTLDNTLDASAFQPVDATLTSIALLGTAADKYLYTTAVDTWAEGSITAIMRGLLAETNTKGGFINDALEDASTPDMGYLQNSNKSGYYTDFFTDKTASNFVLGGSARTDNGGLRVNVSNSPDTLEVYLRGAWYTIIYDFTTANNDLRHTPIDEEIYVWRGDSVSVGLNGRPIVQEYEVSMGAYPAPRIINGGTF